MERLPAAMQALAEALCPPARELASGLLLRPVVASAVLTASGGPGAPASPGSASEGSGSGEFAALCRKAFALLEDAVPLLQENLAALEDCDIDDIEELVDELAAPAFDLVDAARAVWDAKLPAEVEDARPLLATLLEAPAAELLTWMLRFLHAAVDPWAVFDDPEKPQMEYTLDIQDGPLREALRRRLKTDI